MLGSVLASLALGSLHVGAPKPRITPVELRCESQVEPLGIDTPAPRLSWVLEAKPGERDASQSGGYRILVASSAQRLMANKGDLWDSGRIYRTEQNNIAYEGKALKSGQQCFWKVQVWERDSEGAWSKAAKWEMSPMKPSDWKAGWIDDGKKDPTSDADFYKEDPAPLFRKEFRLRGPVSRARLAISGLGYYEASLNGKRIGDHVLDPGWTRVEDRVLYSVYDVTQSLKTGDNCIGVMLGNGWYNPLPLKLFGSFNLRQSLSVGRPRMIAQLVLTYKDGSTEVVGTSERWKVSDGPIMRNNVYLGEVYDARKEIEGWNLAGFDDAGWAPAKLATKAIGKLASQSQPPIRVTKSWKAVKVSSPKPGIFVYDMGVNFAGWVRIATDLPTGTKLDLRYGELLYKDGSLNPMTSVAGQIKYKRKETGESVGGPGAPEVAWQADTFITKGGKESYTPRFTFHGFRYVEISGLKEPLPLDSVTGLRLNSDVESVGEFECSNPMLNELQAVCRRTFLSNIFSVQSDCPHRERLGYGGDIVGSSQAFMANFDMSGFYAKAIRDWSDSALPDGMLTDTAPSMGIQYCGLIWAMAPVLLADQQSQTYGDQRIGEQEYAVAKKWLEQVEKKYPDGIVTDGLSDHEGLEPNPSPEMVTPMYYWSAKLMARAAINSPTPIDGIEFNRLAEKIQDAYLKKYFDPKTGKVGVGSQACQAIALHTGIIPDSERSKVLAYLVDRIHARNDHLSTGILGTNYMLEALSRSGQVDLAYKIVTQPDFPGWGWMLKNGATTLWEHWEFSDNTYSHNHPMFGSVSQWMMQELGGIQPDPEAVGFDKIVIRPQLPEGLNWVKSSYRSVRGKIVSNWKRVGNVVRYEVVVPPNCTAHVTLPVKSRKPVTQNGKRFAGEIRRGNGLTEFRLGSGHWEFELE